MPDKESPGVLSLSISRDAQRAIVEVETDGDENLLVRAGPLANPSVLRESLREVSKAMRRDRRG